MPRPRTRQPRDHWADAAAPLPLLLLLAAWSCCAGKLKAHELRESGKEELLGKVHTHGMHSSLFAVALPSFLPLETGLAAPSLACVDCRCCFLLPSPAGRQRPTGRLCGCGSAWHMRVLVCLPCGPCSCAMAGTVG